MLAESHLPCANCSTKNCYTRRKHQATHFVQVLRPSPLWCQAFAQLTVKWMVLWSSFGCWFLYANYFGNLSSDWQVQPSRVSRLWSLQNSTSTLLRADVERCPSCAVEWKSNMWNSISSTNIAYKGLPWWLGLRAFTGRGVRPQCFHCSGHRFNPW